MIESIQTARAFDTREEVTLYNVESFKKRLAALLFKGKPPGEDLSLFDQNINFSAYVQDLIDTANVQGKPMTEEGTWDSMSYEDDLTKHDFSVKIRRNGDRKEFNFS